MDDLVTIYRLEGTDTLGPYLWEDLDHIMLKEIEETHGTLERTPQPQKDGISSDEVAKLKNPRYGFSSKEQYLSWFTLHERINLKGYHPKGVRLKVYKCPKAQIVFGNKQVVFEK